MLYQSTRFGNSISKTLREITDSTNNRPICHYKLRGEGRLRYGAEAIQESFLKRNASVSLISDHYRSRLVCVSISLRNQDHVSRFLRKEEGRGSTFKISSNGLLSLHRDNEKYSSWIFRKKTAHTAEVDRPLIDIWD